MSMTNENYFRRLWAPTVDEIISALVYDEDDIEMWWARYQKGTDLAMEAYREPDLAITPAYDVDVYLGTKEGEDTLAVSHHIQWWDSNFVSYDARKKRYAFRGEIRLLRQFFEFLSLLVGEGRIGETLIHPRGLFMSLDGINPEMSRDEYEEKVKIVDCLFYLRDGPASKAATSQLAPHVAMTPSSEPRPMPLPAPKTTTKDTFKDFRKDARFDGGMSPDELSSLDVPASTTQNTFPEPKADGDNQRYSLRHPN